MSSIRSHERSIVWTGTLSGSASGDSTNTWIVNFIERLLVRTGGQFAQCTINLPPVKPVRVVVTETVRFFIIEFVCEILEILGRWAMADSSVVLAIRFSDRAIAAHQ